MSEVRYCTIGEEEAPQRLDNYLMRQLKGVPKSHIYRIIRAGEVRINKKRAKPDTRIQVGDVVRIPPVRVSEEKQVFVGNRFAEVLSQQILYEDAGMMVINKPSGIAVHGGSGISLGLIEAMRAMRPELTYLELVHRLDRETSGCIVLAKKRSVLRALHALLANKAVQKTYWALVCSPWEGAKSCVVDVPLMKNTLRSGERVVRVDPEGKASQTHFKLLQNFKTVCLLEARPATGRTHQIRVHSAHLGHPIVGDDKYGGTCGRDLPEFGGRLYLHAQAIAFTLDDKKYRFEAKLDPIFEGTLVALRARSQGDYA